MTVTTSFDWDSPGAAVRSAGAAALADVTENLLEEATRTVPLEEGPLSQGGFAQVDGLEGQVAYTGPYAVLQHEDSSLSHDAGRRSHWLEATLSEQATTYVEHIASRVRAALS